jgi:transposase-like protein
MEHKQIIICPYCKQSDLQKNGCRPSGIQYWRCKKCGKCFQLEYRYNARKQGIKEQITELTLNSSGVRDISRILRINKNTVISELKKNDKNEPLFSN